MASARYLTKSRYKLGQECPTKLYYTGKKEYPDRKLDDPFLEALADGGYQVGELAKHYFPGGHDITSLDHNEAEAQTQELLQQKNVIIYEPAIRFNNLFIRIDILIKEGDHFELIEVKAKSITPGEPFIGARGGILANWRPYLFDVAFQNYVLAHAYPDSIIKNYLMLSDKTAKCATDGLNQKFRISRANNRKGISVHSSLDNKDLEHPVLVKVPVDDVVKFIQNQGYDDGTTFEEEINYFANNYQSDIKIKPTIGSKCKKCEFTCSEEDEEKGFKNGYKECWKQVLGWCASDFHEPNVLEIWNFRGIDKFLSEGKIKFSDLQEEDLKAKSDGKPGLSNSERQLKQVEMGQILETTDIYLDTDGLKREMDKWTFPLHFIDFETTSVALPFTKGRRPYEGVAFQFSHHIYHEDGRIEHAGEFLNTERGLFPNVEFTRALKMSLEKDQGTIFRYADHENSYLNLIHRQLEELTDSNPYCGELCAFIETISHSTRSSEKSWKGQRDMVDMLELVKRYYYDPQTHGSNSIKAILPAILNRSEYLQGKYSKPIYGSENGIHSTNFTNWSWVTWDDSRVIDPYKKLPKLFQDVSNKNIELLSEGDELADGGAALTAYARIQFAEMSEYEEKELKNALLKYCELDTFAMVMIYEAWREMCA